MTSLFAVGVGLLAGAHTATWGMYKDAPHEGFSLWKYARSIILGACLGLVISRLTGLDPRRAADLVILFGTTYAVERVMAEIYKTFFRDQDQSKYSIPMQFAVFGKVVKSRRRPADGRCRVRRGSAGHDRGRLRPGPGSDRAVPASGRPARRRAWWLDLCVRGAWKDAPFEGFQVFKFFRSPLIASLYALAMAQLNDHLLLIGLAATGFTVATTETYKTFFFPSKPRGKFAGTPVHFPDMLLRRQRYIALYVAIWLVVLVAMVRAMVGEG